METIVSIKIRHHTVFFMKYRKKTLLDNDIINYLKYIYTEIGKRYYFEFDAAGNDGDNVYLFVSAEPKYYLSRVMQIIQNIAAIKIFKEYYVIKKDIE
jgi:putative transposase